MWSRNGSPVATLTRPRPSRTTFAVSCVSLLLRTTSAVLLKADFIGVLVRGQPFQGRQAQRRVPKHLVIATVQAQDAAALEKCVHSQWRGESSGARCRQRVIWTRGIVAEGHSRIGADENRARV